MALRMVMPTFDRHITEGLTLHQRLQDGTVRTYYKLAKTCHTCGKVMMEEGDCLCFTTLEAMERAKASIVYCRPQCWWRGQTDEERARQLRTFLEEVDGSLTAWSPEYFANTPKDDPELLEAIWEWLGEQWSFGDESLAEMMGADMECPLGDEEP